MKHDWFEQLTQVMGRMASGDAAALETLYTGFGDPIRAAVRKELRRLGVAPVDPSEVDGLALDVCTELFRRAASWSPEFGVTPWFWARLRVRAIVGAYVGQFADPLPEGGPAEEPAVPPPAADPVGDNVLVAFDRLAAKRSDVRLLHEALSLVARPQQQEILFQVRMQAAQGDPSPARTVARAYELRPESVRQTHKRLLDRLRRLAVDDPHFAALADLPFLRRAS